MSDYNIQGELGWDDTIENDGEYTVLPEGDYDFEVISFERGRSKGSDKMPASNMAILTIRLIAPDGRSTLTTENLVLHQKMEWKLCSFFTAIGQRTHGEKMVMNWAKVPGSRGRCSVYIDKFKGRDGELRENNKIKAFLEPVAPAPAAFRPGTF